MASANHVLLRKGDSWRSIWISGSIRNQDAVYVKLRYYLFFLSVFCCSAQPQTVPACTVSAPMGAGFTGNSYANNTFYIEPPGGKGNLTLSLSPQGCYWSVSSNQSWLTVSPPSGTSTSGSIVIVLDVTANATTSGRRAALSLGTSAPGVQNPIDVFQNSNACVSSISPTSASVPASGGNGSFALDPGPACWIGYDFPPSWITFQFLGNLVRSYKQSRCWKSCRPPGRVIHRRSIKDADANTWGRKNEKTYRDV